MRNLKLNISLSAFINHIKVGSFLCGIFYIQNLATCFDANLGCSVIFYYRDELLAC